MRVRGVATAETLAEEGIAPGVVVREVTREDQRVRARVALRRVRDAACERLGGRDATDPQVRRSGEVRVRELQYAHYASVSTGSARA